MGIELNSGSLYIAYADDNPIKLGESADMSMEYAEEAISILNGLNKSASFTCEASSIDLDLLNDMSPLMPPDKFTLQYYINIMIQKRWHKKARVNKKWLKRYGMKPDTVKVIMDAAPLDHMSDGSFEFESKNHRYILRSYQQRKGLKIVW